MPSAPTSMDIDKTLADDIISCCLALAHDTEKANDLYDRLRHYETHVAEEHQLDPIHIRSYLPNPVIDTLTRLIPDKHFVVNTRSAKLSKAARIWTVPARQLLFQIGFDYARQGDKFFSALFQLAEGCSYWPSCLLRLREAAWIRRSQPGTLTRSQAAIRFRLGLSLHNIEVVLQSLPRPPPKANTAVVDQSSSNEKSSRKGAVVQEQTTNCSSPHDSSSNHGSSSAPDSSSPHDSSSTHGSSSPHDASTPGRPAADTTSLSEGSTPEVGRTSLSQQEPPRTPTRELAQSGAAYDPSDIFDTPRSSPNQHRSLFENRDASVGHLSRHHEPEDIEFEDDQPIFSPTDFDDACDSEEHDIPSQHQASGDPAPFNTHKENTEDIAHDDALSIQAQEHSVKNQVCRNLCSTYLSPQTQTSTDTTSRMPQPPAKRACRGEMWPLLTADETGDFMQGGQPPSLDVFNVVLVALCEQWKDVVVVPTAELTKLPQDGYLPDADLLDTIFQRETILLPYLADEGTVLMGRIEQRQRIVVSAQLFGPFPSDASLENSRKLTGLFIRYYLPKTPPLLRMPVLYPGVSPPGPASQSDSAIHLIAAAIYKAARMDTPTTLHAELWRRVLLGCIGGTVTDWELVFPPIPMNRMDEPPQQLQQPGAAEGDDKLARFEVLQARYLQQQRAIMHSLSTSMVHLEAYHQSLTPTLRVVKSLHETCRGHQAQLQAKLSEATERQSYKSGPGGRATATCVVQISQELEAAERRATAAGNVCESLQGLDQRLTEMYHKYMKKREVVERQ
ncbi:hypothetical protein CGCF415_v015465 [Colletotrichum fructicola]|nr:hypothetical protein CGCF415_v015465 [Colletotrichum fructicola]KAF4922320.1 hypothetical protein CGCF245_v015361 [Colletotrichum fructicola]KAF5482841.1 hypothetical protein CGCF413_v015493 [Colletotrichum fructicola]